MAVNRQFKREGQPEADFLNCIAFGKTGETIAQHFIKGKQIAIIGSIQTGSYDAKDGTKRYTTDIVVDSFDFIGSGDKSSNNNKEQVSTNNKPVKEDDDLTPINDDFIPF